MNSPSCSTVRSYPLASLSIVCIRANGRVPRFVSMPSMNYESGTCQTEQTVEETVRRAFQYTFICSACCSCAVTMAGASSTTAMIRMSREVHIASIERKSPVRATGLAPVPTSSATSRSLYTFISSSFSTPRSIHTASPLRMTGCAIFKEDDKSATDQVSVIMFSNSFYMNGVPTNPSPRTIR